VATEVQTYNLFFGADLRPLFTPGVDPIAAASQVWADMQASDIPARARAAAEVIAADQPDLLGLQEVSTWRSAPAQFTGTEFVPTGPFVTDYDALALLLGALADLGTPYQLVVDNTNFSNETFPLPVLTDTGLRLATFTDRDVILARSAALHRGQLSLDATQEHTYQALLTVTVAGQDISVPRGWSAVDVTVRGRTFRFANTHLEAYGIPGTLQDQIRNPQAVELAAALAASPHPVVLVGDINARPTLCKDARVGQPEYPADQNIVAYQTLLDAGLAEVWPLVYPKDPCGSAGWTSGQTTLDNAASTLDHRIDDVFVSEEFRVLQADVTGDTEADRTTAGLWPSDHASTWAKIRLNTANAH
jgi:endonuclease/exonuclease/phosphatase family metal-dependent hydrolase